MPERALLGPSGTPKPPPALPKAKGLRAPPTPLARTGPGPSMAFREHQGLASRGPAIGCTLPCLKEMALRMPSLIRFAPGTELRRRPSPIDPRDRASSSKRRRSPSPTETDQEEYEEPLPPHPQPATSSAAPAKKKKKSSRPQPDVTAMMQSLLQAMQHQQQQSSSDSSDDDLADEVFEEPPLPPLPEVSPLAEDLAISSSDEDEAPLVSGRCSPALPEVPVAAVESPQPEETSYSDLLSHPPPSTEGDLSMPAVDLPLEEPPPVTPGPPSSAPVTPEDPTTFTPSLANVTPQSVLFGPLGSQTMIFKVEEGGGEISGSFILDGEHFGTIIFLDVRLCSFRIPSKLLIRHMAHVLHRCSFSPFSSESKELQPFEHCVLLRQGLQCSGAQRTQAVRLP